MDYSFTKDDFEKAVNFAINYYLDPTKVTTGRTSAEPRGIGAIMDDFVFGKLIEIGVQKILERINNQKEYLLDFDIKSTDLVKDEADVIKIKEDEMIREPKLFVEIKSDFENNRWIGLTEEQFNTMKNNSKNRDIYIIYAQINVITEDTNPRKQDIIGIYLKSITHSNQFDSFEPLDKVKSEIQFVLNANDLIKHGTTFSKGDLLYETDLFKKVNSIRKKDGHLKKRITFEKKYRNFKDTIQVVKEDGESDDKVSEFNIEGSFEIYLKQNPKSIRNYVYCISDVKLSNDVLGVFILKKGNYYNFNLKTLGRDPILKRNNIWLSKRRIDSLLESGLINDINTSILKIANDI